MNSKEQIAEITSHFLALHRALLDRARRELESQTGKAISPLEFFNLLRTDNSLQWLQPLLSFIVEADLLTDKKHVLKESEIAALKTRFAKLFLVSTADPQFERYQTQIQGDTELSALHERAIEAFRRLDLA